MPAVPSAVPPLPTLPAQSPRRPAGPRGHRRIFAAGIRLYKWMLVKRRLPDRYVPRSDGRYGPLEGEPLTLLMLGDSLALGVGVRKREETFGSRLAQSVSEAMGLPVDLHVLARAGATTKSMQRQVASAARYRPGIAVMIIGSNDTLMPAPIGRCAQYFGRAVSQLRATGWEVVVMPCADPGSAPGFRTLVRWSASPRARRLARRQSRIARHLGTLIAPSSVDDFRTRAAELLSPDGVHPSPQGYAEHADRVLPIVLEAVTRHGRVPASAMAAAPSDCDRTTSSADM